MIPKVRNYGDFNIEEFSEYLSRWPKEYSNFPNYVIEHWVYRHNPDFVSHWVALKPENWVFLDQEMSNEEIMSIQHLNGELAHWDYVGEKLLGTADRHQYLAIFMAEKGTFPVPIIVALNADGVQHPRGRPGELMKSPLQIIEGHRRLGLLRAMIRNNWPTLKGKHNVCKLRFGA